MKSTAPHTDWGSQLRELAKKHPCQTWKSLPIRYARLVEQATREKQSARPDVFFMCAELERLRKCLTTPNLVRSAELLADELASQIFIDGYEWSPDRIAATATQRMSSVEIAGNEVKGVIRISATWNRVGDEGYQSNRKWVPEAKDQCISALSQAGFEIVAGSGTRGVQGFDVGGEIAVEKLLSNWDISAQALGAVSKLCLFTS